MAALGLILALANVASADTYSDISRLLSQGQTDAALARADAGVAANPRDPQMRFLRGVILNQQGRSADALEAFTQLTREYPELPQPYNNLAALYAAKGEFGKARDALESAIRLDPKYAIARENLGDVYARLAAESYNSALRLEPANASAPPKLALLRQLFGDAPNAASATPAAPIPASRASPSSTIRKPVKR